MAFCYFSHTLHFVRAAPRAMPTAEIPYMPHTIPSMVSHADTNLLSQVNTLLQSNAINEDDVVSFCAGNSSLARQDEHHFLASSHSNLEAVVLDYDVLEGLQQAFSPLGDHANATGRDFEEFHDIHVEQPESPLHLGDGHQQTSMQSCVASTSCCLFTTGSNTMNTAGENPARGRHCVQPAEVKIGAIPYASTAGKAGATEIAPSNIDANSLRAANGAWVGVGCRPKLRTTTVEEGLIDGLKILRWDGKYVRVSFFLLLVFFNLCRHTLAIVDKHSRIICVLVGRPDDCPEWESHWRGAETAMSAAAKRLSCAASTKRGDFPCFATGVSHGGGQTVRGAERCLMN